MLGSDVGSQRWRATGALLGVALVWGASFTLVKAAVETMPVADFLATRFTLAALLMLVVRPSAFRAAARSIVRPGVGLGIVLAAGVLAQTEGLRRTEASVAGVLAGTAFVLAVLVGALGSLRRPGAYGAAAVAVAAATVVVVARRPGGLGTGDWLVLLGAVALAVHLVGMARAAERHDLWTLTVVQLLVAATAYSVLAVPEGITAPPDGLAWVAVVVTGGLAVVVAHIAQVWAQRRLEPPSPGLLLATEPVFAVLVAVLLGGEPLSWVVASGGALVVGALGLAELGDARRDQMAATAPEPDAA